MKHTPGPWKLSEIVEAKHTKTNMRRIRSVNEGLEHGAVCEVYGVRDGSEAHANAVLIVASPRLLAALKLMVDRFMDTQDSYGAWENEALDEANAAIREATDDD